MIYPYWSIHLQRCKISLFIRHEERNPPRNLFFKTFYIPKVLPYYFFSLPLEKILNYTRMITNKRELKRTINYVCSDLFAECIATSLYNGASNKDDMEAILSAILSIHNDYVCRISHPEPGMKPKAYYKDLITNFNKQVTEIIDQISNIG